MTKMTTDVGGGHVLIEDPDGRVARIPLTDLDELAELIAAVEPVTPGARRRDREGDVWTRQEDGSWKAIGLAARPWADAHGKYGPLYPVAVPE